MREAGIDLSQPAKRDAYLLQANQSSAQLWKQAVKAVEIDSRPATTGLFLQSLNDLIDAAGKRGAALARHVPEFVVLLMLATILIAAGTLGYSSGLAGHRVKVPAYALVVLIACVTYLIIDLERPRRGAIKVSQQSLLDLQKSIAADPSGAGKVGRQDALILPFFDSGPAVYWVCGGNAAIGSTGIGGPARRISATARANSTGRRGCTGLRGDRAAGRSVHSGSASPRKKTASCWRPTARSTGP